MQTKQRAKSLATQDITDEHLEKAFRDVIRTPKQFMRKVLKLAEDNNLVSLAVARGGDPLTD
jgi:uncharacterized protein involved in propanediol utilization